jgi:hypothetical protein
MDAPRPLILLTIRPNTWPDEEKLRHGLRQMTADDSTISVSQTTALTEARRSESP